MRASERAVYDPVLRRYRATCTICDYQAVRAKREAAEHALNVHLIYEHDYDQGRGE